ncbi:DUF6508 domain-containing protein [Acrocarpospora corrugata]|uniref:DUF6508 domain-containing protein n=1 Tax=Acrocarpospora corrugata TaxID=35763 RepID=UPI0030EEBBBF
MAALLAEQPSERWERLFLLYDGLTEADLQVSWGSEEGPYSEPLNAVISMLVGLKITVVFDWPAWRAFPGGNGLDQAPVADAARLATTLIRGERFSDGTIHAAIQNGTFHAILRRLRHWYEHERQ